MNWHILDPLGGEEWVKFMCGVENFSYFSATNLTVSQVSFTLPVKNSTICITTGPDSLRKDMNWYRIHNFNSESSPFILIGRSSILPEQAELAVRHFEHLTGLTLSF